MAWFKLTSIFQFPMMLMLRRFINCLLLCNYKHLIFRNRFSFFFFFFFVGIQEQLVTCHPKLCFIMERKMLPAQTCKRNDETKPIKTGHVDKSGMSCDLCKKKKTNFLEFHFLTFQNRAFSSFHSQFGKNQLSVSQFSCI